MRFGIMAAGRWSHRHFVRCCAAAPACVCHEKQQGIKLFRNCINDGSWSAVHALQQECTNRPKVLCSKGRVLSVWVKRCRKASGECNGAECK